MGVRVYPSDNLNNESDSNSRLFSPIKKSGAPESLLNGVCAIEDDSSEPSESIRKPIGVDAEPTDAKVDVLSEARKRLHNLIVSRDGRTGHDVYTEKESRREVLRQVSPSRLCLSNQDPTDDDILLMLLAAQEKFDGKFKIFGSQEFIDRCTQIAFAHKIDMHKNTQRSNAPKL